MSGEEETASCAYRYRKRERGVRKGAAKGTRCDEGKLDVSTVAAGRWRHCGGHDARLVAQTHAAAAAAAVVYRSRKEDEKREEGGVLLLLLLEKRCGRLRVRYLLLYFVGVKKFHEYVYYDLWRKYFILLF